MAQSKLFVSVTILVLALASFAEAQSKPATVAKNPQTQVQPAVDSEEEFPEGPDGETVEQKLKRMDEWQMRKVRNARMKRLVQEMLPAVIDSPEQEEILNASIQVEEGQALDKARDKVRGYDTPAMRKVRDAREEAIKMEREARVYDFESKRNTILRCKSDVERSAVYVHPTSSETYRIRSHSSFTIHNSKDVPVDISFVAGGSGDSLAVERMCPGGNIKLQFALDTFRDGEVMTVSYSAVDAEGKYGVSYSPSVDIRACRYNGCYKEFPATWEIK